MTEIAQGSGARRVWLTLFLVAVTAALLVLLYHLRAIFMPLFVAFLLAYVANPLASATIILAQDYLVPVVQEVADAGRPLK